jgi:hypothetical protein
MLLICKESSAVALAAVGVGAVDAVASDVAVAAVASVIVGVIDAPVAHP